MEFVGNNGVAGRTVIDKEEAGVSSGGLEVLEDEVEGVGDSIVNRAVSLVGKLERVQPAGGGTLQVPEH